MCRRLLATTPTLAARPLLSVILLAALAAPLAASSPEDRNKALVRDFYEVVLNGGDFDAVERFVAPGVDDLDREKIEKLEAFRRSFFPDLAYVIEEMVAEGGTVVVRLRETGTHTGTAKGIPATGEPMELRAVVIYRIEDGRIRDRWILEDNMKVAEALGYQIEKPGS